MGDSNLEIRKYNFDIENDIEELVLNAYRINDLNNLLFLEMILLE